MVSPRCTTPAATGTIGAHRHNRRGDDEDQGGEFEHPQVVLTGHVRGHVPGVVREGAQRGGERQARVAARVRRQGEAPGDGVDHQLPGGEDHPGQHPGLLVPAGRASGADEPDDPDDRDRAHRDHDGFPGQGAVSERQPGEQWRRARSAARPASRHAAASGSAVSLATLVIRTK
jgi:hypothetical protein